MCLQITWVPALDANSSVFDRFMANSPRIDRVHVEGIHLQAKLKDGARWGTLNETLNSQIEDNVRDTREILIYVCSYVVDYTGFLARSLCDYRAWKTNNPLEEVLHEGSLRPCYSSSFSLLSKNEGNSFFTTIVRGSHEIALESHISEVERNLIQAKQGLNLTSGNHRFATLTISHGPRSPAIEVEYLEAWIAKSVNAEKSWSDVLPVGKIASNVVVVTSIKQDAGLYKLEYAELHHGKKLPVSWSVVAIQAPGETVTASVHATIVGEGFHRRYVMDMKATEHDLCGKNHGDQVILVRIPVSNTAYLDLDEIRVRSTTPKLCL
ncbi:unnamed protein product [Phytophthora fragariaefolia]|uniref:Unnamed protein product n=1 Tax=Phytophthora fragariaefolia TaxID=1490495 RepID=A0A9W7CY85_9STRA|nr:unnamed protein product [Phytophthora fragariaefolia]